MKLHELKIKEEYYREIEAGTEGYLIEAWSGKRKI